MRKKIDWSIKLILSVLVAFAVVATIGITIDLRTSQPKEIKFLLSPLSVSGSVVKISSAYGQGSGTIVERSDTHITILTAGHVLTDPDFEPVFTITTDCGFSASIPVESIFVDETIDLAVCKIPIDESFVLQPVSMAPGVKLGDAVTVIGFGFFGEKMTTHGFIGVEPEKGLLILDGVINPGHSGGAVFNQQNELVGIAFAKIWGMGFEGIGIIHSVDICKNVLDRYRILMD